MTQTQIYILFSPLFLVLAGCPQGIQTTSVLESRAASSSTSITLSERSAPATTEKNLNLDEKLPAHEDASRNDIVVKSQADRQRDQARKRFERRVAAESNWQNQVAEKWDGSANLNDEDRKRFAIASLCTHYPPERAHAYDSQTGIRVTAEARDCLSRLGTNVIPELTRALEAIEPDSNPRLKIREAHVIDLLARTGDRSVLVPLVDKLLRNKSHLSFCFGEMPLLTESIAKIGDAKSVALLVEAYPWLSSSAQDAVVTLVGMTRSVNHLSTLINWAELSEAPSRELVASLAGFRDPKCKRVFLEELGASGRQTYYSAVWGLALLGDTDLDLTDFEKRNNVYSGSLLKARNRPPPIAYPIRFTDDHPALEKQVHGFIAARQREALTGKSEKGLRLTLSGRKQVAAGERLNLMLKIENTSEIPRTILNCRDGSDVGWVCPIIRTEVWGPDHRYTLGKRIGRCGNVNGISKTDFQNLRPTEIADILTWGHHVLTNGTFRHPGKYRIRATYDTKTSASGAMGDDGSRPAGVVPVQLVSQTLEFEIIPGK